jgi:uncharacterized protein (UPF0264 family)
MTGMLASVVSLAEALQVREIGVDIIDLKNPAQGALGALPVAEVGRIVGCLNSGPPVSATIGDVPMDPDVVKPAVEAMASTGVDYVKIGFFPGGDWGGVIRGLSPLAGRGVRLVAVLFGDESPELDWIKELATAGFVGAMLDTRDKSKGSLRVPDIAPLLALKPDYLGFRGALCGGERTDALDSESVRAISNLVRGEASSRTAA